MAASFNLTPATSPSPTSISTPDATQSGAVDVGDTVSEISEPSAADPAIPHRLSSSAPEVQPDDRIASCDNLDRMQTHGTSDASPAGDDDSGATLMADGGLDEGHDVVGILSEEDTTSPCSPTLNPSFSDSWFAPWLKRFLAVSDNITWRCLVWNWVQFEIWGASEGVSLLFLLACPVVQILFQRLPTASRPKEVSWWMKHRRNPELCPQIEKLSEFTAVWKQWWVKM